MDASIELQKQVKDNAEDLRNYLSGLATWTSEMNNQAGENKNLLSSTVKSIPPIRNHSNKRESTDLGNNASSKVSKRISSFNYDQWDKFDVEKACEEVDKEETQGKSSELDLKKRDEAQYEKDRGNRFVKNEKWDDAIICYSKAIKCYPKDATFYANRALCYLRKKQYRSVETDCTAALQLEADYVKALQRRATARRELNQLEDALRDLDKALILEPGNTALKADLALVKQKLASRGVSKPKIMQDKEPLKWIPPAKAEPGKSSANTSSTTNTSCTEKPALINTLPAPVVIEKAEKHQKSVQDTEKRSQQKSPTLKVESIKKISVESTKELVVSSSIKWFDKEGTTVVQPIIKPPHRRSKEPLRRLPIKECPNYDLKTDVESSKGIKSEEEISSKDEPNKSYDKAEDVPKSDENPIVKCPTVPYKSASDLPVPSTSVQFLATWKLIKSKPELCFEFLKKIPANDLSKIFQDCLESDIFSDIISILEGKFIEEDVPVYEYLLGLSKVRRFSMLTMFLSASDKKGLQKLFEYCVTKEECPEESVNTLKKLYEL